MLDELVRQIMFYKIINGLAQMSFEDAIIMHLYIISVMFFIMKYFWTPVIWFYPEVGTNTKSTTVIRLRGCSAELHVSSKVGISV